MRFSSKKSARRCICSVSRVASITHGVSPMSMSFSSWFFSKLLVNEFSVPFSFCHSSKVRFAFGIWLSMNLPRVLAYSEAACEMALSSVV